MNRFTAVGKSPAKLSNGLLVDPVFLDKEMKRACHYVQHVSLVAKDDKVIVALVFPHKRLLSNPDYAKTPEEGCFCPRNLPELGKCLSGCFHTMNQVLTPGYAKLNAAIIVNSELSSDDGTLSAAKEVNNEKVIARYGDYLRNLFGEKIPVKQEYVVLKFNN